MAGTAVGAAEGAGGSAVIGTGVGAGEGPVADISFGCGVEENAGVVVGAADVAVAVSAAEIEGFTVGTVAGAPTGLGETVGAAVETIEGDVVGDQVLASQSRHTFTTCAAATE